MWSSVPQARYKGGPHLSTSDACEQCLKRARDGVAKGSQADELREQLQVVAAAAGTDGLPPGSQDAYLHGDGYYWVSKSWLTGEATRMHVCSLCKEQPIPLLPSL